MGPTLRKSAPCGIDIVDLTLSPTYQGQRGFYTLTNKDESSPESQDPEIQSRLWAQTLTWAKISRGNTALQGAFS
jgi:hypothetical protein